MWIKSDEGRAVNLDWASTLEIEPRRNAEGEMGFALVAQLQEVGAQAKVLLRRAAETKPGEFESPSRIRLAWRDNEQDARETLDGVAAALSMRMPSCCLRTVEEMRDYRANPEKYGEPRGLLNGVLSGTLAGQVFNG